MFYLLFNGLVPPKINQDTPGCHCKVKPCPSCFKGRDHNPSVGVIAKLRNIGLSSSERRFSSELQIVVSAQPSLSYSLVEKHALLP